MLIIGTLSQSRFTPIDGPIPITNKIKKILLVYIRIKKKGEENFEVLK